MSENAENNNNSKLQKRPASTFIEKGQYVLAFTVIGSMLLVAQFPLFVVLFFGVFAYFLWKSFSSGSRNEAREIFEFYLAANNILRDDERRWFGFEMHEVAAKGEQILRNMSGAPPLVYFALGALYNKMGDHPAAVSRLSYVIENESSDEAKFMYPSPELRNYVRVLRKLERDPAEAPLTSGAVRALERARKNRGKILLEQSREVVAAENRRKSEEVSERLLVTAEVAEPLRSADEKAEREPAPQPATSLFDNGRPADEKKPQDNGKRPRKKPEDDPFANRKPISEVLHDIYDRNVQ